MDMVSFQNGCMNLSVSYGVLITLALIIPAILVWRWAYVTWNALQPKRYKNIPQN